MGADSIIICAFENIRDAQRAASNLHGADFLAKDVKLIPNELDEHLDNNRTDSTWSQTYPLGSKGIMGFFARLFGRDDHPRDVASYDDEAGSYFSEHYHKRRHLILVRNPHDREGAIRILESCGGLVEDRASSLYQKEVSRGIQLELSEQQEKQLAHEGAEIEAAAESLRFDEAIAERGPDRDPLSRDRPAGSKLYL